MKRFTSLVFLSLFAFQPINSQDLDTASISGVVQDQNGAAIRGAVVEATRSATGSKRNVLTDAEGRYRLIQLEPGSYTLQVNADGFSSQEVQDVKVISAQSVQLVIILTPAVITGSVVVVNSDAPPLDVHRTIVGTTINARDAQSLPIPSRSILDLIFTLPGVTEEPLSTRELAEDRNSNVNSTPEEAGVFALAGAPAYSNNLTIDGLDNNDDRAARERFQPSSEAVEEVQVITNQFSAEYGRASGGRVNLRTRGGANEFHGRGFYFFRDEALDANTFKNNSLGLPRLPLQEHVSGFTFSGPFKLLNSVFFTAYEQDQMLDSALIDTLLPVSQSPLFTLPASTHPGSSRFETADEPALSAEVAPYIRSINTPSKSSSLTARVDHQFTELHNLSLVYQRGRLTNLRGFGGGNRLAEALQGKRRNSEAISVSDNLVLSAALVNQARFQYSRLLPSFSAPLEKPVVLITLNDPFISGTLVAGSSTSGSSDRREARYQLQNILSLVSGNHSLKLGVDYHKVKSEFIDLADTTGTFSFASAGDFLANTPSRFRQNFQTVSSQRNTYSGFFVQDEWQLLPQLLVSYGLRYERESIINDTNNFGPRVSLAYNPFSSGRLVLRFGAGIFYNRALLRTIDDFTLGRRQLFFDTNALINPQTGKLMTSEERRSFIATQLHFPDPLKVDSALVKQFGSLNTDFSRRLEPSLRIPESYQMNFGIERDLGAGFTLEANATFTRGIHLWREFNANAPRVPAGYKDFTSFLASRDFANFVNPITRSRPIYGVSNAGELVRFVFQSSAENPNSVNRIVEFGVPVSVFNLSSPTSSTTIQAALAALNSLRPDPARAEVEELIAAGNSFYRGLTIELRRRFVLNDGGLNISFRAGYTLSSLIDDGVVNTSDALRPGDFRAERARSLLDRRHRFVFAGIFTLPKFLGSLQLSPIWRIASGAPFNISIGGVDRNLDDVGNDRPNFSGDRRQLRWRAPGSSISASVVDAFSLPPIGQSGNLPRNAGIGPAQFLLDLNVTREFRLSERVTLRPLIEFDNVLNKTVFSFGSEFIDFNALSPAAKEEQRQAFLDSFLLATRTTRPRQIRVGLRLEF
ncbi:MAG TPA: TonB-dependent receptor [Pyrinomonadaceae bacterium]